MDIHSAEGKQEYMVSDWVEEKVAVDDQAQSIQPLAPDESHAF